MNNEYEEKLFLVLTHELLHASTKSISHIGIVSRYDYASRALNEGITDMLAEDVIDFDHKKSDSIYYDITIFSRIIRLCVGEKIINSAYFKYNVDSLEKACNNLAHDSNYFQELKEILNDLLIFLKNHNNPTKEDFELYYEKVMNCYINMLNNLVIPKFRSIYFEKNKKAFIMSFLKIISTSKEAHKMNLLFKEIFQQNDLYYLEEDKEIANTQARR